MKKLIIILSILTASFSVYAEEATTADAETTAQQTLIDAFYSNKSAAGRQAFIVANATDIGELWTSYVSSDYTSVDGLKSPPYLLFSCYLGLNIDILTALPYSEVYKIGISVSNSWIDAKAYSYTELKSVDFTYDGQRIYDPVILDRAIKADDYDIVNSINIKTLSDNWLGRYVEYMIIYIDENVASDIDKWNAYKSLAQKLRIINTKQAASLKSRVQSIQDDVYGDAMQSNKIK